MAWSRQILFGDVDAMFASAAVVKDPSFAGLPIAVGGPPPRGIIAAASYAVRAFGVHSAMPTAEAVRLCPRLVLLPPDRPFYRKLHDDMRAVTGRIFPATEWSSIDEFYADTTDLQRLYPDPHVLGTMVKQAIFSATGLCCTVGIATGKTVAKIAADAHKPDGLAIVQPATEAAFLADRPFRALPGIGPKTAARLQPMGIITISDLLDDRWALPLRHLFGRRFPLIQELARGVDREPVVPDHESKSMSHETTFEQDTDDRDVLERTLKAFLRELARDLRQDDLSAGSCTVKLKDARFSISTKRGTFPHSLNYDPDMWPTVRHTLHALITPGTKYRLAGLALTSLAPTPPGLFDRRRAAAIEALDVLTARHGSAVIGLGGVTKQESS